MVSFKSFVAVAAFSGLVSALPRPQDSALGEEVAVSAPNGIPLTDSVELASQSSFEAASATSTAAVTETSSSADVQVTESVSAPSYGDAGNNGGGYVSSSSTSAYVSYSTPSYGSGSSSWGGSGYDDCVSQCLASYAAPAGSYKPTATSGSSGSSGTGATHTVIVAPSQGVLRYIPFAVNASVGDTVKFMWGANNHTVTKGSALLPCNKTTDAPFASGSQNKDFVFTQVVNDTNPVYFYCATPTHCQQGMFGMINPPSSFGAPSSVGSMMADLKANNSNIAAYASATDKQCANNAQAAKWGSNIDVAALPEWAHQAVAENVLYTRNFLAMNGETLKEDGSVDLSAANDTPLMIPQDLSAPLNNAGADGAAGAAPSSSVEASSPSSSPSPSTAANSTSGASTVTSSRVLIGVAVALTTFFAL